MFFFFFQNPPLLFLLSVLRLGPVLKKFRRPGVTQFQWTVVIYRVALNFGGSFILRIGDYFCFAGTNFCNRKRLVFLAGN